VSAGLPKLIFFGEELSWN